MALRNSAGRCGKKSVDLSDARQLYFYPYKNGFSDLICAYIHIKAADNCIYGFDFYLKSLKTTDMLIFQQIML